MNLTERLPSPPRRAATMVVHQGACPALLRGLAFGLPLALLLWLMIGVIARVALP